MGPDPHPMALPPSLLVDAATCPLLVEALRLVFHEVERRDGARPHERLVQVFRGAEAVARYAEKGLRNIETPALDGPAIVATVNTSQAAAILRISPQAVAGLARRRTLAGHKGATGWTFARADVDALARAREERHA